jgi:hypothetical protein
MGPEHQWLGQSSTVHLLKRDVSELVKEKEREGHFTAAAAVFERVNGQNGLNRRSQHNRKWLTLLIILLQYLYVLSCIQRNVVFNPKIIQHIKPINPEP